MDLEVIKKFKVTAGVPRSKTPVTNQFFDAFHNLVMPEGSQLAHVTGGNIPDNLNQLVDDAIKNESTHLFIVENDSVFLPDTILRLLSHDVPVVAGHCRQRDTPFRSYIYKGYDLDGRKLDWYTLKPTDRGLIKCDATGMGGILINMDVFKKLERPYFYHYYDGEEYHGQDILFGCDLIEAGIDVYCDTDVMIGHVTECMIGSNYVEGIGWHTTFTIHKATVGVPQGNE